MNHTQSSGYTQSDIDISVKKMNNYIRFLITLCVSILLVGCDKKEKHSFTKAAALEVNSAFASERLDSFGADGPYRWTGSSGFPLGLGAFVWVEVRGQKTEKEYPRPGANEWYVIEQFVNAEGDGFAVVYKYASKERLEQ